jgi:four helix bundle protein
MNDLIERTKRFAVDTILFTGTLPLKQEFSIINRQLIKCASSVGANYRSACRAKSKKDFISKLSIVEEEADESIYWLELLEQIGVEKSPTLARLKSEASQLVAIIVASKKTARLQLVE